ncbi:flagellar motor switch protein FliN/FliY [Alkalicoccus daliensis]|uniref:Flagellar motor switch protein FliN/FliY n=2 Tax=Alkalicoccus daliensis TaxID=745820 RepID=A0A1H0A517_9BACI|nr:flagellar motor switch protein FliN/FliY [Alkalicoccus daliensis]
MNDDMLSQDEINELLNGMDAGDEPEADEPELEDYLDSIEEDALGEIGNISFGSSATALSTLLNQKVEITTPTVHLVKREKLAEEFPKPHVAISVEYTEGFEGLNLLIIRSKDAAIIADLMMGNDGTDVSEELTEMEISAVQEAMNQMMGSASTSMSTIFNQKVDISPPGIQVMNLSEDPESVQIPNEEVLVQIAFNLKIGDLIDSKIMQMFTVSFAKDMVQKLMNPGGSEEEEESFPETMEKPSENSDSPPPDYKEPVSDVTAGSPAGPPKSERVETPQVHHTGGRQSEERNVNVQPAAFSTFDAPQLNEQESKNLDMLMEIPLEVTVELGRTKKSIKEILEFSKGSIIELDKLAGEPVDILVNQRLIAKGEVVVIDENFGVRLTEIVSKEERIKNLR